MHSPSSDGCSHVGQDSSQDTGISNTQSPTQNHIYEITAIANGIKKCNRYLYAYIPTSLDCDSQKTAPTKYKRVQFLFQNKKL